MALDRAAQSRLVVVMSDSRTLVAAVGRHVRYLVGSQHQTFSIPYQERSALLSQDLLGHADLFILDLYRLYPEGRRAEGIAVAERLARRGTSCLVIAHGDLGKRMPIRCYWDPASPTSLADRIRDLLDHDTVSLDEVTALVASFRSELKVPQGHR